MLIILIAAATAAIFINLNEEEMRQTGIAKLTPQERMSLQEWIEEHHSKKTIAQNKKAGPIVQEVLKAGRYVRLSDNTLWEIDPPDTPITQSWITPTEIKVGQGSDPDFPYTLTNTLTGSTVKARKAQSATPPSAPASKNN